MVLSCPEKSTIKLKSRVMCFNFNANCLVIPTITGTLPSFAIHISNIQLLRKIRLADPKFFSPYEIDVLFSANTFLVQC